MKKNYIIILVLGFLIVLPSAALASIQYPVSQLGNCKNEADCKLFCDKPENVEKCLAFAKENNLMSQEEINTAEKFIAAKGDAPGGCTTKDSCEAYCNNMDHIDECISFAEKNNLMSGQELEEAKKVQAALARGVKAPPCKNKKSCDDYCESPDHMEECITFAAEAGFMQGEELVNAQKMLQALKKGVKPPPCKGKDECDAYCSDPNNMELCMNFAMEAGMMSEQDKEGAQKMLQALKKGVKPPPCKGKDECDAYCQQEEHMQECINFSVAAGMMSEEDAQMARKTGGKGPGGCMGKEECDVFCKEHQEECFNFARDNGMIPPEELKKMEEGGQNGQNNFQPGPGATNPGGQMMPPQAGPGGCKTPEECQSFCESNPEACKGPSENQQNMMPPQGQAPQCEGENCFGPPNALQPGQNLQGGQQLNPPSGQMPGQQVAPPTGPGAGGSAAPGDFVPQVQPAEQQQPQPTQPAPVEQPPAQSPAPALQPTSSIINTDSFVGSLLYALFKSLVK